MPDCQQIKRRKKHGGSGTGRNERGEERGERRKNERGKREERPGRGNGRATTKAGGACDAARGRLFRGIFPAYRPSNPSPSARVLPSPSAPAGFMHLHRRDRGIARYENDAGWRGDDGEAREGRRARAVGKGGGGGKRILPSIIVAGV